VRNSRDELVLHAFDALNFGDVPDQAGHAHGASVGVTQRQAGCADGALLAAGTDDAECRTQLLLFAGQSRDQFGARPFDVVGVDGAQHIVHVGRQVAGRAIDFVGALVPHQGVGGHVPIPDTHAAGMGRELEALVEAGQRPLGPLLYELLLGGLEPQHDVLNCLLI
jgi:hypothetical protein